MFWSLMNNQKENQHHIYFQTCLGTSFFVDVAFATEDPEVWDVGLPPNEKFIGRLLQEAVEIDPVGCMTCGVDGFRPKSLWDAIIIQHCSCKSDQGPILPLHHSILLGCVSWWEFMLDANVIAKLFNLSIPKLRAIVTPDLPNTWLKFILSMLDKSLEDPHSLALVL